MLHVTNGDCAADLLREAGMPGVVLPWRDVLHEGPVPAHQELGEVSRERASFIAASAGEDLAEVERDFRERDQSLLDAIAGTGEIVLWFEADLYDQLQLVQVLDILGRRGRAASLVCIGEYPGVEPFHGLGNLSPPQMATLFPGRKPVTAAEYEVATGAWQAITSPTPERLDAIRRSDTSPLPFLAVALTRWLEDLPATGSGLARTERQALEVLSQGPAGFPDLFVAWREREPQPFMGDVTFRHWLDRLMYPPTPAVQLTGDRFSLTPHGGKALVADTDVLAGRPIDRWLGGTHLTAATPWRWDAAERRVVRVEPQ